MSAENRVPGDTFIGVPLHGPLTGRSPREQIEGSAETPKKLTCADGGCRCVAHDLIAEKMRSRAGRRSTDAECAEMVVDDLLRDLAAAREALAAKDAELSAAREAGKLLYGATDILRTRAESAESRCVDWAGKWDVAEKAREAAESRLRSMVAERDALREALKPFTHPDLLTILGQNVEGEDSPIYGRNKATLYLRDFRNAARALARRHAPDADEDVQSYAPDGMGREEDGG